MIRQVIRANRLLLSMLLGFAAVPMVSAQEDPNNLFPYQAIVSSKEANVHSGPGTVHYVTAKLTENDSVEVYRHDPGGWCAIRPVKGSFSLIPATAIEELGNGVGEVTEDGTQAWVGTQLGPVEKPLWQVKLRSGEKVTLLGIATWPDPEGFTTSWYQVEPPAGEFRWIKMDDLKLPAAVTRAMQAQTAESTPVESDGVGRASNESTDSPRQEDDSVEQAGFNTDDGALSEVELAAFQQQQRQRRSTERRFHSDEVELKSTGSGWRKARFPIHRDGPADQRWSGPTGNLAAVPTQVPESSALPSPPERLASADLNSRYDFNSERNGATGMSVSAGSSAPLTPRMTELELKLNEEMVKEPNLWRLGDLQVAAQQIATTSSDRLEQEQAQRFLNKLGNCLYLREQYIRRASPGMAPLDRAGLGGRNGEQPVSNELSLNTLYDAHGWLKELVRDGGRAEPTYVLQNEAGKVTHHVQAGPGMNLSSYVSKRIGVIGQRGYHTRLKLDHVTVTKVIELK